MSSRQKQRALLGGLTCLSLALLAGLLFLDTMSIKPRHGQDVDSYLLLAYASACLIMMVSALRLLTGVLAEWRWSRSGKCLGLDLQPDDSRLAEIPDYAAYQSAPDPKTMAAGPGPGPGLYPLPRP